MTLLMSIANFFMSITNFFIENSHFSYEIYNSIVGIIYPKDIKECFQNLKDGDWQKSNYDNVLYFNCLIYICMGII